jgi:hypothetical protein
VTHASDIGGYFDDLSSNGEVSLEFRKFYNDDNNQTEDMGLAMLGRLEIRYESEPFLHVFRGFGRVDQKDKDRDVMILEDFYLSTKPTFMGNVKFLAGYKIFNWTATEAFHPADIINSRNYDSDLENLEKQGELVVETEIPLFSGNLSLFYLPKFESPIYPGSRSRLGAGVDINKPMLIIGDKLEKDSAFVGQYGARLFQVLGSADLGLHYVKHVDRNYPIVGTHQYVPHPMFPGVVIPTSTDPVPYYFEVTNMGLTLQYVWGSAIHKVEANHKKFENKDFPIFSFTTMGLRTPKDFTEVAYGFEYMKSWMNGHDSVFIFEAAGIFGLSKEERQATSVLQRDILIGYRHAFNDVMGKELFISILHDLERDNERLWNLSYTQRLSDYWKIKLGLRIYDAPVKEPGFVQGLETFNKDHYGMVSLTRYF